VTASATGSVRPQRIGEWRAQIGERRGALLLLGGGALLIAIGAGLIAAHVTVFALDETLIQQSAVHYTSDLPHSFFHDLDARATNRLYPLVLSIAFHFLSGASAVRAAHLLNVVLFVSAAVPIFLLARILLRSELSAACVALLSIAVPWLTLTSALFTENLSYPLFWWMMLAVCGAIWRPSAVRDVIAMLSIAALVGTRAQFAAVYVGYLLALLAASVWRADARRGLRRRVSRAAPTVVRSYPFALAVLAAGLAYFFYERASGHWQHDIEQFLGSYSTLVNRNGLPENMFEGTLIELIALPLGVGLLPAIVSLGWFAKRLARPQWDRAWVYLATSGLMAIVFIVLTVYSQGGYLGAGTEERYFFYVVPCFWLGSFAALRERNLRPVELLIPTLLLAALFGAIPFLSPLTQETAFLAPAESAVPHILSRRLLQLGLTGLSIQDALTVIALVAGLLTAVAWRRSQRARLVWTVGVAAAAQLLLTGYSYAVIDGKIQGIRGRTGGSISALGWVDRSARSSNVAWLTNLSSVAPPTNLASPSADQVRTTLFWNSKLRRWLYVPETGLAAVEWPLSALPGAFLAVDHRSGLLLPSSAASGVSEVVSASHSSFLQLAGLSVAHSPDGVLTLVRLASPPRAIWLTTGLQPDGFVVASSPVTMRAFATPQTAARGAVLTMLVAPVPAPRVRTELSLRLGGVSRRLVLRGGGRPETVRVPLCFTSASGAITGVLRSARAASVEGRTVAGALEDVSLEPAATQRASCAR
jgi:hypothetical protein